MRGLEEGKRRRRRRRSSEIRDDSRAAKAREFIFPGFSRELDVGFSQESKCAWMGENLAGPNTYAHMPNEVYGSFFKRT